MERILRDIRVRLNQPKAENSRWSDAELVEYVNECVQQMFLTINEYSEGQFDKTTSLDVVNAVETVDLPTDCFAIRGVWWKQGTINRRLEYRQNVTEDFGNDSSTNGQANYEPYYYLRGNKLVFRPIPGFTSTNQPVYLEYTAFPNVLVYGGDTLDSGISPLFKQIVVAYGVTEAKRKDDLVNNGNTRAAAESHRNELWKQFVHQVSERSKAPQYVQPFEPS